MMDDILWVSQYNLNGKLRTDLPGFGKFWINMCGKRIGCDDFYDSYDRVLAETLSLASQFLKEDENPNE